MLDDDLRPIEKQTSKLRRFTVGGLEILGYATLALLAYISLPH